MRDRIDELTEIWQEKVEMRNPYSFGEEDISFEEFAELFKDTFEIIKAVKNKYIFECVLPERASDTLAFLKLLTTVSQYTIYDNVSDESENKAFTVTALIAEKLTYYASDYCGFCEGDKFPRKYYDSDETNQGLFVFFRSDYPFYNEEDWEHEDEVFKYNVYEANFDEINELAKQLL